MEIVTYDSVNPLAVLDLNMTCLGYALTPERATQIRETDPRPFPFLALYAVVNGVVAGQVGVFRLPVVTTDGPAEVGGLWAVATDPRWRRRGIARRLIEEAHLRMRAVGLRVTTLGTSRNLVAHSLYLRMGYVDAHVFRGTLAHTDSVGRRTSLHVDRAKADDRSTVDALFARIAAGRLGFARRHPGFLLAQEAAGDLDLGDVWLVRDDAATVGYAIADCTDSLLSVRSLLVAEDIDVAAAIFALARATGATQIRVQVDDDQILSDLERAGYPPVHDRAGVLMVRSIDPSLPPAAATDLLGIGTSRFLISNLDIT